MFSWITDPKKFMHFNIGATVFFILLIPVSIIMGWVSTVEYVSALSIYALVAAHLSTYAAARTEVLQADADKKLHEAVKRLQKLDPDHERDQM